MRTVHYQIQQRERGPKQRVLKQLLAIESAIEPSNVASDYRMQVSTARERWRQRRREWSGRLPLCVFLISILICPYVYCFDCLEQGLLATSLG